MTMPDFLAYAFFRRALMAGAMIAVLAPLMGSFIVARKASLLTDAFAHTVLAGVGLGFLMGFDPLWGALGAAVLAGIGMERLIEKSRLSHDAIQAVFLSGGLAFAVLLTHFQKSATVSFESYLFGSLLTVRPGELWLLLGTLVTIATAVGLLYWKWLALAFNEDLAQASGMNARLLKTLMSLMTAVTVALSLKVVGGLLVGALIVIPVLTARQFAASFRGAFFTAIGFSLASVLGGLILSYYFDLPSGSAIVLLSIALFGLSLGWKGVRG